jgi:hypothetical protein
VTVKLPRSVYVDPVTVKTLIVEPTAFPGTGIVTVMAGLNVAEAAPVIAKSTAAEVEAKTANPAGTGMPWTPEKVAVESAGTVKVNEGVALNDIAFPSAFFVAMVVLGSIVMEIFAKYPVVTVGLTIVVVEPVVPLPSELRVTAKEVVALGFVTTGVSSPPPPPHPPAIIKAPIRAATPTIFTNLLIFNTSPFINLYPFPCAVSLSCLPQPSLENPSISKSHRRVRFQ